MKKIIILTLLLNYSLFVLADEAVKPKEIPPYLQGSTFYLNFEGNSLSAKQANGKAQPARKVKKYKFVDGLQGKGLLIEPQGEMRYFRPKNNNLSKPGSISMWVKPVNWMMPKDLADDLKLKVVRGSGGALFMTSHYPKGYLILSRRLVGATKADDTLLRFLKFKNNNSIKLCNFKWQQNKWYNVVITWNSLNFIVYINGNKVLMTSLKQPLKDKELSDQMGFGGPAGTLLDEIVIYNHELSPEKIKQFYNYFTEKHNTKN